MAVSMYPAWSLGDRLRKALDHGNCSVAEMAEILEVSRNTVSNYINDHTRPKASYLRRWSLRCGVAYDWLVTGTDHDDGTPSEQGKPMSTWNPMHPGQSLAAVA